MEEGFRRKPKRHRSVRKRMGGEMSRKVLLSKKATCGRGKVRWLRKRKITLRSQKGGCGSVMCVNHGRTRDEKVRTSTLPEKKERKLAGKVFANFGGTCGLSEAAFN